MSNAIQIVSDERCGCPSASAFPLLFSCAGAWQLQQRVAEQSIQVDDSTKDSIRGTKIHHASEVGDTSDLSDDDSMIVERSRALEESIVSEWLESIGSKIEDCEIHRELRLWVNTIFSCQIDLLVLNHKKNVALISDLKSGRAKVAPPVRNHQLRGCAVAVFINYGVSSVRCAITQPMMKQSAACDYNAAHLQKLYEIITERLEYIRQPNLPLTVNSGCCFCSARAICPEAKKQMSVSVGALTLNWDLCSSEDKLRLWKAASVAEDAIDLIKKHIRAELKHNPDAIKGLVAAPDQHPRKVTDTLGLADLLVKTAIGDQDWAEDQAFEAYREFLKLCKISIKDVESFYKDHMPSGSAAEAKRFLEGMAGSFITEGFRAGAISVSEPEE